MSLIDFQHAEEKSCDQTNVDSMSISNDSRHGTKHPWALKITKFLFPLPRFNRPSGIQEERPV